MPCAGCTRTSRSPCLARPGSRYWLRPCEWGVVWEGGLSLSPVLVGQFSRVWLFIPPLQCRHWLENMVQCLS